MARTSDRGVPGGGGSIRCLADAAVVLAERLAPGEALGAAVGLLSRALVARARGGAGPVGQAGPEGRALGCLGRGLAGASTPDAFWLGEAYQLALDAVGEGTGGRRRRGVFYTPERLVDHLIGRTLAELDGSEAPRVLDPACGCGGFLVGVGRRLVADRPGSEVAGLLHGVDIDPHAVALCRLALWLEFGHHDDPGDTPERLAGQVRCADALLDPPEPGSFDLVLGNPPFLNQLAAGTARGPGYQRRLRDRFGASVRAYTDPAALFLHLAVDAAGPGGVVGMVLPGSLLGARDAGGVRARVARLGAVRSLWLDTTGVFDARVSTIAITVRRGVGSAGRVSRFAGGDFAPAPSTGAPGAEEGSWGRLASDLLGVPAVRLSGTRTLGEVCEITAGFRDEYYAIAGVIRELPTDGATPGGLPVVTVGMIDPASLGWGGVRVKVAGRLWARPGVVLLPGSLGDGLLRVLAARQARPKLLVATQTRVIEAAADPGGEVLAMTPVVTVVPHDPEDLWRIGAVLSSPAASAWLATMTLGTARSLRALKPSAASLRELPVPDDWRGWEEPARAFRRACEAGDACGRRGELLRSGELSLRAGSDPAADRGALFAWWRERLPRVRGEDAVRCGEGAGRRRGSGVSGDSS